jgi:DNA-binding beta-propeller fold protein YncE
VSPIVDRQFLPAMGRMTPRLRWRVRTIVYVTDGTNAVVKVVTTGTSGVAGYGNASISATVNTTGSWPSGVAVTPDGAYVYIANAGVNQIAKLRTSDNSIVRVIGVGSEPYSFGKFIGPFPAL